MCDFKVPTPLPRPCYAFEETPTVKQLRKRAMEAMMDHLSIQWFTPRKIVHSKTGPVSGKRFIYDANVIFAGVPYTNGDRGLFQFLEYYDHETGELKFPGTQEEFNQLVGCTCAGGVMWGWSAVCHTLTGTFVNFYMTPKNGCYPVGPYHIPEDVDTYQDYSTARIIEENGVGRILTAYCCVEPGDAVTSSPQDHTMMCISKPTIVRKADGSLDLEASYIMIMDQRGGSGAGFYDKRVEDDLLHYSGRTSFKYTFRMLLQEAYIPVAPAELLGREPYAPSQVSFENGVLTSNYPMAVVKLLDGENTLAMYGFKKWDVHHGIARNFPISQLEVSTAPGMRLLVTTTDGVSHEFTL